ncbi:MULTISPECIES: DUF535 family protein [unclassified Duganella]|uniref:DUF535 family protein n=1 Tax=unclassified Duganella TaxID=2636909 RepID=UPI000E35264D|nr:MULTISPECIES: DUF535 family protein [unclassified Duganella]RFP16141.1 DUF535 domain-containing protein [Duganella sp. BJB475]RFP32696.1 DUF535 domain-containing protein [Duganella sp. BJB476]
MENISIKQNLLSEFWASAKLRLVHRFFPLIKNLRGHIKLRSLLSGARLVALSSVHPELKYKYLRSNYLFSSLSIRDALAIVHHHYRVFASVVPVNFFPRLFDEKPLLWEFQKDGTKFSIRMTFPHDLNRPKRMLDHEGDLALMFEVDGVPIYILCMTLVPNQIAKKYFDVKDAKDVIFIGRVQGVPDQFDKVRAATKLLHDITPARLLISATESIAKPFSIETIVGVCNSEQLSKRKDFDESECLFDYDAFWTNIGAHATPSGLFSYQLGVSEKPIEEIQQKHRSRTLAKRRFRAEVVDTLGRNFLREISYPAVSLKDPALLVHFGIRKS